MDVDIETLSRLRQEQVVPCEDDLGLIVATVTLCCEVGRLALFACELVMEIFLSPIHNVSVQVPLLPCVQPNIGRQMSLSLLSSFVASVSLSQWYVSFGSRSLSAGQRLTYRMYDQGLGSGKAETCEH